MARLDSSNCLKCISGIAYNLLYICQPVIICKCPHKDAKVQNIEIKISHFWSNIQWIVLPIFLIALHNSIVEFLNTSSLDIEFAINFFQVVAVACFTIVLSFMVSKKRRCSELRIIQNLFYSAAELSIPVVFTKREMKKIKTIVRLITAIDIGITTIWAAYAALKAYKTAQYSIWTIDLLYFYTSFNLYLIYICTYHFGIKITNNMNDRMIKALYTRKLKNVNIRTMLINYICWKKAFLKSFALVLIFRGAQILLLTIMLVVGGVTALFLVIKYPQHLLKEAILHRICEITVVLLLQFGLCFEATGLEITVTTTLFSFSY